MPSSSFPTWSSSTSRCPARTDSRRAAACAPTREPPTSLTARTRDEDVVTGYARGGDGYVTKPFEPQELLAKVDALVGVGRMRSLSD